MRKAPSTDGGYMTYSSFLPSSPCKVHSEKDADRDSGICPQYYSCLSPAHTPTVSSPQQSTPTSAGTTPVNPAQRTAEWLGRYVVATDQSPVSSPGHRAYNTATNAGSPATAACLGSHVLTGSQQRLSGQTYDLAGVSSVSQHRLSGQSYDSSGVSSGTRHSYYSSSSGSSVSSLDRLEDPVTAGPALNVHHLYQAGLADSEVLRAWLTELHYLEYYPLFINAGYDMPTISRMTPEDLTAIGITKPAHRKRIKAEISHLHIHDGIPDFRPGDVREWLQLLCLEEYIPSLTAQGYLDIQSLADITWEDLEDIGIKKLGHQKKVMLALDRLKKMNSRGAGQDRRGSSELLEPPSAYPSLKLSERPPPHQYTIHGHYAGYTGQSGVQHPVQQTSGEKVLITCPRRSPSSDNLTQAELTTFQQHRREPESSLTDVVHLRNKGPVHQPPDLVAIQVNRAQTVRISSTSGDSAYESESGGSVVTPTYHSFQTPDHSHLQSTPVNHLQSTPNHIHSTPNGLPEDREEISQVKRPSAKVSPRPKPKPVAKIVAKRASQELSAEILKPAQHRKSDEVSSYSSNTLPRKSSKASEPIYDIPAGLMTKSDPSHSTFGVTHHSTPNSPAHNNKSSANFPAFSSSNPKAKRPPPPPPKRTNSMKTHDLLRTLSERNKASTNRSSPAQDNTTEPPPQPCTVNKSTEEPKSASISSTPVVTTSSLPPPPPAPYPEKDHHPADLENPLCEVIRSLEQGHTTSPPALPPKPFKKDTLKLGDWQDELSSGEESDSSGRHGNHSNHAPKPPSAPLTAETNLPFANENVGTIKQRNAATKASILSSEGDMEGDDALFSDETDTIKRKPKPSRSTGCEVRNPSPLTLDTSSNSGKSSDTDVLNDIDNMLQDLTSELDAMLESDLS